MRRDITALQIKPGEGALSVGAGLQLNLFGVTGGGGTDLIPANMATWASSNQAVAEVTRQGRLSPRRSGTATITATYAGKTARADFTVVA
jgi:large repetitive protein